MSSPAAALRRASAPPVPASVAAPSAAPSAAPKVASSAASSAANQCFEFREFGTPCKRRNCRDAECCKAKASAPAASPKHSAPAKSAGVGGGISAQLTAMEANLIGHIDLRFQAAEASMNSGFLQLNGAVAQSQLATQQSFQGLANAMATAFSGGQRQLPPPERRQIGNGAQEVVEPQRQISYGQNAGWDPNAERSGMSATSSSQGQQSVAATSIHASSAHMPQSSSYFPPPNPSNGSISRPPADQRFLTSGSVHSAPAPQSLAELMRSIPESVKGFRGLCGRILSDAAAPGAKAVPLFTFHKFLCAWQMSSGNDDLACALMALTYGKPLAQQRLQPGIASALKTTNLALFMEFFRRISAQYPSYVLSYNWKPTGIDYKTSYRTFSSDQNLLWRFIHEHILA